MVEQAASADVQLLTSDRVTADALVHACRRRGYAVSIIDRLPDRAAGSATLVLDLDALPVGSVGELASWAEGLAGSPTEGGSSRGFRIVTFGTGSEVPLSLPVYRRLGAEAGFDELCEAIARPRATEGPPPAPSVTSEARKADDALTPREQQLCRGLLAGHGTARLAEDLNISEHTVRTHLQNIFAKLSLTSRAQVVAWAAASGRFLDETAP